MNKKAKKVLGNSKFLKFSIDFNFWAKKALVQDPESGSALR